MKALLASIGILLSLSPSVALAQDCDANNDLTRENILDWTDCVAGDTVSTTDAETVSDIATFIANEVRVFISVIALLVIVAGAAYMVISQEEDTKNKTMKIVGGALAGVVALNVVTRLVTIILDTFFYRETATGVSNFQDFVVNFLLFLAEPIMIVTMLVIVVSGLRAIVSYGNEQGVEQLKKTIGHAAAGLALVSTYALIANVLVGGGTNPTPLILQAAIVLQRILGVVGIIAVLLLVVGATMMILDAGRDELYNKGKDLVIRVCIGIVILGTSLAIIQITYQAVLL